MFKAGKPVSSILMVRMGAMGDIIHTLPAVAWLSQLSPARISWLVEPRWAPLLEENPLVDRVVLFRRDPGGIFQCLRELRSASYDFAVDFQGLLKSAIRRLARRRVIGFTRIIAREGRGPWCLFRQDPCAAPFTLWTGTWNWPPQPGHRNRANCFRCQGRPEGELPSGDFVLASPLAGWGSKQWPMDHIAYWPHACATNSEFRWCWMDRRARISPHAEARLPHHSNLGPD